MEDDRFLLGPGLFSGANLLLVLGSVGHSPCVLDIVNDEVEAGFLEGMGVLFCLPLMHAEISKCAVKHILSSYLEGDQTYGNICLKIYSLWQFIISI